MDPLLLVIPVVLSIAAFALWQRRAVTGARTDAAQRIAAGGPVDDAGPLEWQEVAGALKARDSADPVTALGLRTEEMEHLRHDRYSHIKHVEGRTRITGERHGRRVRITLKQKAGRIELDGEAVAPFVVRGSGGTLRADGGAADGVARAVEHLAPSKRWSGVRVTGGGHGVTVTRDGNSPHESWFHDLWLAEHLAEAAGAAR